MKKGLCYACTDVGLLIIRVGLGAMFIMHGWGKLTGGPEAWAKLATGAGIGIMPTFFGFMAAISETAGGLMLAAGLFTKVASLLLFMTMVVAAYAHLAVWGDPFMKASHAIESAIMFLGLFFIGAGKFSADSKIFGGCGTGSCSSEKEGCATKNESACCQHQH